jgi:hypothetical protein
VIEKPNTHLIKVGLQFFQCELQACDFEHGRESKPC